MFLWGNSVPSLPVFSCDGRRKSKFERVCPGCTAVPDATLLLLLLLGGHLDHYTVNQYFLYRDFIEKLGALPPSLPAFSCDRRRKSKFERVPVWLRCCCIADATLPRTECWRTASSRTAVRAWWCATSGIWWRIRTTPATTRCGGTHSFTA